MCREHFKVNRICSSKNYKESKEYHKKYIREQHSLNISIVETITTEIGLIKHPYVKCFGKLMPITAKEAATLKIEVIWK